ncbi:Radical SAM domain protein [Alkaliphilus metalliredigens QYMF]|uniref:Radical SAM domain protein n=1 Tax=Alkaliphilus metalliredigens (strain QYMF) TaxID=293826 RepID=A6TMU2_ALKMQ|nr:radical SAM protein [Alkaliphilus metalliredigens]ABR47510.1 Radical SAM domain protein [Alkaliphilus metalliredigens QYMF]
MKYEGSVYRPPSEAYSLIVQTTIGCSHNACTFCDMYKDKVFRVRKLGEIEKDLIEAREQYNEVKKIFLADGNSLALKTSDLKSILIKIKELFPECQRIGVYSAPKDILRKTTEELSELQDLGLKIAYLGVESGSDEILKKIKKGVTSAEMIEAGKKIVGSGIKLSVTLISGLGGKDKSQEHAKESARVINEINPHYLGLLTLMVQPGTEMYEEVKSDRFQLLSPKEVMLETKILISHLEVKNCVFRSNHASNYIPLAGTLPAEREKILGQIEEILKEDHDYKEEYFRRL